MKLNQTTPIKATSYMVAAFLCLTLFVSHSLGQLLSVPVPEWENDPNTTFQSYTFTTDSPTALPETWDNAYGTPGMSISSAEWIDIEGIGLTEILREGGAWDLAPNGSIQLEIPVAPPLGAEPGYIVDIFIGVVYDPVDFLRLPLITISPTASIITSVDPVFDPDPSGAFAWGLKIGESTINNLQSDFVTVFVSAPSDGGSLIESLEVHTRYEVIPEPRAFALAAGLVVLALVLVRRRRG